jgi:outer membrane protein
LTKLTSASPLALGACALLAFTTAAQAQDILANPLFGQDRAGFELNLGGGALLSPTYAGSSATQLRPFPFVSGGYGDWLDFDLLDGVRVSALNLSGFSLGPMLRLRDGRSTDDSRRYLTGLRNFSDTVEVGGFIAYTAGPLYADVSVTQDVARSHGGAVLDARVLLSVPIGRVAITAGPQLRATSRQYAQSFYGIDERDAARSGYGTYRPGAGIERIGALLAAQWRVTDRWSLQGFVEYGRLQGDAADSPLVAGAGGSRDQVQSGLFLSYGLY